MKNIPKNIYLNMGFESDDNSDFNEISDVTWSEGVTWKDDIEYILATPAIKAAVDERQRQIEKEGYDESHDDDHFKGEIARAASTYAQPRLYRTDDFRGAPSLWPWHKKYWKPTPNDRKREITKAMALLIAEYERIERKEANDGK